MGSLLRQIERISGFSGKVTAWLLAPLIVATVYDVGARYLFSAPTQWAYEVGYMMMGAHALLGMAYTLREAGHVRIDAFSQMFSQGAKAMIDLIGYVALVLPCLVWMTWSLWDYWVRALVTGELSGQSAWNPVIWPFKLIFFIAFVLLVLQIVAEIIKAILYLRGKRTSYESDSMPEAH
ncbi:MAG: TRAP transporter small permease subunit [Hyphomicrobiaceae bacterium]|nr:MAG: TRAP transporter small permease subunit [Hyphomicrobiaceae bacterium]